MNETTLPKLDLTEATPSDYPAVARLLAENFTYGKFVLALGKDVERRAALIEILLQNRAFTPGTIYVARLPGQTQIVGTIVIRYDNASVAPADRRTAREAMTRRVGRLRAWWANLILKLLENPKLPLEHIYADNMVVEPAFRRQRIGQALFRQSFAIAHARGKTEVHSDVISSNAQIRGLCKLYGWEVTKRNYLAAPFTLLFFGFAGIYHIRRLLTEQDD